MVCWNVFARERLARISRTAAVLLMVLLLLGLRGAVSVYAEENAWALLQTAIDRADRDDVIVLSEDITALPGNSRLTIPAGKCVTLDLNGHTLDRNQKVYAANNGSGMPSWSSGTPAMRKGSSPADTMTTAAAL